VQFRLESTKLLSDDDFILGNGEAQFVFRSMIISFLVFTDEKNMSFAFLSNLSFAKTFFRVVVRIKQLDSCQFHPFEEKNI
jgi:hypothetical protein